MRRHGLDTLGLGSRQYGRGMSWTMADADCTHLSASDYYIGAFSTWHSGSKQASKRPLSGLSVFWIWICFLHGWRRDGTVPDGILFYSFLSFPVCGLEGLGYPELLLGPSGKRGCGWRTARALD